MSKLPICEQCITREMAYRERHIGALYRVIDTDEPNAELAGEGGDDGEEALDALAELPRSVSTRYVVRIELLAGQLADGLEATVDSNGHILRVDYYFCDSSDQARCRVDEGSPLYRFAEYYVEIEQAAGRLRVCVPVATITQKGDR